MAGYTRQSIADIINGAEITAPPLNAEFNQLSAAFNATTGHSHDGTSGNSPKINLTTSVAGYLPAAHGGVGGLNNTTAITNPQVTDDSTQGYAPGSIWENTTTGRVFICVGNISGAAVWRELVQVQTGNVIFPEVNNTVDLGSVSNRFQDIFLSGGIAASGNMSFGGTLNVNGSTALSSTLAVTGLSTLATVDINAGSIDGTVIGAASRAAGNFTTISTTGQATLASADINGGTIDGTVIGGSTAATVTGTNVTATTGFSGPLTGSVTGNVTGNLTGNVTGNVAGNVTGDVTSTGTSSFQNVTINGSLNMNAGTAATVTGLSAPVNATDAATKLYVDTSVSNLVASAPGALDTLNELAAALGDDPNFATTVTTSIATKVSKAGDTMTGNLAMSNAKITGLGTPTAGTDATTKTYVDGVDATKLNLSGGTMTGGIVMGANKITSTATPTVADDLTRKGYVDGILGSATAAATSASNASTSASNAASSEAAAGASATAASNSASAASTSETNASGSASAASTSATNASNSATAASNSSTAASASATNSANSASAAALSETNAATSETNAASSASAAATSAANASTSETNAAGSASAASTSETNAANSAAAALTSEQNAASSAASINLNNIDINGGTIDGTVIGETVRAAINGTTGNFSGNVTASAFVGDGSGLTGLPAGYTDADLDTHLNTGTAISGEVLSWTGTDYDWVPTPSPELYAENPSSPTVPVATGSNAVAIGSGAVSSGLFSVSLGSFTDSTATNSVALGASSQALGVKSVAILGNATARESTAIGVNNLGSFATAAGEGAMALGGSYASGTDSFAAAIANNTSTYGATGANSVAIGDRAKATGNYSSGIGRLNTVSGPNGAGAIGQSLTVSGEGAFAAGQTCFASGAYSQAIGNGASTQSIFGKFAKASGFFSNFADMQTGTLVVVAVTTDATPKVLTANKGAASATNQIILPNNSAYAFHGTIVARQQASQGTACAAFKIEGLIRREGTAASTVLVNSATTVLDNTPAWGMALSADTTNGGLKIEVTGAAATNIRFVATISTSEVTF